MRRFLLALSAVALVTALVPAAEADHSWGGYHWSRPSNPFSLTAIKSTTSAWDNAVAVAISDWNASTVIDLTTTLGSTSSTERKRCTVSSGKIRVCNAGYGKNGWLGIAEIWLSGPHIVQARTKLNDSYFSSGYYNTPAWRALVTCQEIGHDFGLDHQDENFNNANLGTCMDYTNNPSTNQHPNQHDYDQLLTIYGGHADIGASSGSSSSSAPQPKADRDTRVQRDGKYIKVTHIFYAPRH